MNKSLDAVVKTTLIAMIGANPRHYLSTQLEFIQGNLHVWEEIDVSRKTISRSLHNLAAQGLIEYKPVSIPGSDGKWHGKKLIIKATAKLYQYARLSLHCVSKFMRLTERTIGSLKPILTKSKVLRDYPRFPAYILSDTERCPELLFKAHSALLLDSLEGR